MQEKDYDHLLQIRTTGVQEFKDQKIHYNRYEATPYVGLDVLFQEYELNSTDGIVDFGCGKGRLLFYIHQQIQIRVTGVEVNKRLYEEALENRTNYLKKNRRTNALIHFDCCPAEKYAIKEEDNKFYFFNPFSIQIFMKVVHNILLSVEQHNRTVDIILYYPSTEYIQFLQTNTVFELVKEVHVPNLYEKNNNERFLIYRY